MNKLIKWIKKIFNSKCPICDKKTEKCEDCILDWSIK